MANWWQARGFYFNLCLVRKIFLSGDSIILESDQGTEKLFYDSNAQAMQEYIKLMGEDSLA